MSYASLERSWPDTDAEQPLEGMPLRALQEKAQALGVGEAELDDAEEQAELVALKRSATAGALLAGATQPGVAGAAPAVAG